VGKGRGTKSPPKQRGKEQESPTSVKRARCGKRTEKKAQNVKETKTLGPEGKGIRPPPNKTRVKNLKRGPELQ